MPGALLVVLLSLTGASEHVVASPPAALADSVDIVRKHVRRVALVVAVIVIADLAVGLACQWLIVPTITKKVVAAKLVPLRTYLRVLPLALAAISPLVACALAATYAQLTRRTS